MISPAIFLLLKLLPYALIWLLLTFIYMVMPNAKVQFKASILAAIVAGSIYQMVQWGYVEFQVGVARQNAIYGSFAALPLFLIWVQLSWLIVLLGAEISFAIQSADTFEFGYNASTLSPFDSKLAALLITRLIVNRFSDEAAPLTAPEIAATLELPRALVQESLHNLESSAILAKTDSAEEGGPAYQPACDINFLSVAHVVERLEQNGAGKVLRKHTEGIDTLSESLRAFNDAIAKSPVNRLLKDI
jgi:membrane protein